VLGGATLGLHIRLACAAVQSRGSPTASKYASRVAPACGMRHGQALGAVPIAPPVEQAATERDEVEMGAIECLLTGGGEDALTLRRRMAAHAVALDATDPHGWTVLMHACRASLPAHVTQLLRAGANVDARATRLASDDDFDSAAASRRELQRGGWAGWGAVYPRGSAATDIAAAVAAAADAAGPLPCTQVEAARRARAVVNVLGGQAVARPADAPGWLHGATDFPSWYQRPTAHPEQPEPAAAVALSSAVSWLPAAALPAHYSLPAAGIRPESPGAGGRRAVHEAITAGRLARAPGPAGLGSPQARAVRRPLALPAPAAPAGPACSRVCRRVVFLCRSSTARAPGMLMRAGDGAGGCRLQLRGQKRATRRRTLRGRWPPGCRRRAARADRVSAGLGHDEPELRRTVGVS
jgi:hypothetical protein